MTAKIINLADHPRARLRSQRHQVTTGSRAKRSAQLIEPARKGDFCIMSDGKTGHVIGCTAGKPDELWISVGGDTHVIQRAKVTLDYRPGGRKA